MVKFLYTIQTIDLEDIWFHNSVCRVVPNLQLLSFYKKLEHNVRSLRSIHTVQIVDQMHMAADEAENCNILCN